MVALLDTIEGRTIPEHRPCSRLVVDEGGWRFAASQLSAGSWTLLGLWGDTDAVHMALLDEGAHDIASVTIPSPAGPFPFSVRRRAPSCGHSPGACGARSLRPRTGRLP